MHQSYNPDYFKNLFHLESGNFWFSSRNLLLIWSMDKFFPNANSFLEIGCGTGFVLSGLHKHYPYINLAVSEIFAEGLEFAKQRTPNVKLFQMDARNMPFEDEYDIIGAFDVIEHIEEDELVLSQMYKAVKPGGGGI